MKKMNKKGGILLRDVVFMIIIFGGIMSFMSIFVVNLASEYGNQALIDEYDVSGINSLGSDTISNISDTIETAKEATDPTEESGGGLLGEFGQIGIGVINGASEILKTVFASPIIITNAVKILLIAANVPTAIATVFMNIVATLIYAIIIFVLISAALRGGKL